MKILFWAHSPCIRTYKQAKALRSLRLETVLVHTGKTIGERYPGLFDEDAFDDIVKTGQVTVPSHFVEDREIDVIHTAHPPDSWVRELQGCGVPIVHDFHDMYSLETDDELLRRHEADAAMYASGLVYVTDTMERHAASIYPNRTPIHRVVGNAVDDLEVRKIERPWPADEIHVVYVAALPRWDEGHFRDLKNVVEEVTGQGIHFHVHAIILRQELKDAEDANPLFHVEPAAVGAEMASLLTRYDAGLWPQRSSDAKTRKLLNLCSSNKVYEYWQAGIPVICYPAKEMANLINTYKTGTVVKTFGNLREILERQYEPTRKAITMREEAAKLVDIYKEVTGWA